MKTSRQNYAQTRTRYGKSVEIDDKKLSQSFFNSLKRQTKFNTIGQVSESLGVAISDDEKINNLITKNDRLRTEIRKIQKVLKESQQLEKVKPQYGIKLPQIRTQVADRQLENAYKQIKHYEFQIEKLKSLQGQGTYATRLTKCQRSLRQKQQLKDKLKIQLQKIQKSSKHFTKSLIDDRTKILLQNKSKKLNDQLKMYEKKWSEDERKKNFFLQTQKKKRDYVIELEKKLWAAGVQKSTVEDVKRKIFEAPAQNERDDESDDEEVEDRSPEAYKSLLSELKLLKKVTVTNDKLLQKMQTEKNQFAEKNRKIRIQSQQADKQIEMIQNEIAFLKKHIDPQKLKPNLKPQGSFNSRVTFNSLSVSEDNSAVDPLANKSKEVLDHHFQVAEIGAVNRRSEKFNDRKLLGKRSAKIVGVDLYENRMQLLGFRFTYLIKEDEKIQGVMMQLKNDNERYMTKKELNLDSNDYVTSIECFINPKKIIVGKVIKGGNFDVQKRFLEMNPKEYPSCAYACIAKEGIELFGVQKVEPQSF